MGFFDKLFGRDDSASPPRPAPLGQQGAGRWDARATTPGISYTDEQALARYRYMLKTAPPEALEEAHAEAFARLTPEQRQLLLQQLAENAPAGEAPQNDDPRTLARAATRAEMRQPGMLERTMGGGGMGGGMMGGMGGAIAGTLLASVAGTLIGSAVAHSFFSNPAVASDYNSSSDAQSAGDTADPGAEAAAGGFDSDGNADPYGDPGLQEGGFDSDGNADPYGDPGDGGFDSGGDFGGDDFGGGDFGGDF